MAPRGGLRDLQARTVIVHGVILGQDPRRRRQPVVRAPAGGEETEGPPVGLEDLPHALATAPRAVFLHTDGGIALGGRLIQRHDSTPTDNPAPTHAGSRLEAASSLATVCAAASRETPRVEGPAPPAWRVVVIQREEWGPPGSGCHGAWTWGPVQSR